MTAAMQPSLWQRIRRLFPDNGMNTELVVFGNAFAAIGLGLVALFKLDLSLTGATAVAIASFVTLTVLLLFKATLWLPAAVGGAACTIGPTALLAGLGLKVHAIGMWIGGAFGLLVGLTFAFHAYSEVGKLARRKLRGK
jgi:hypothetical protein